MNSINSGRSVLEPRDWTELGQAELPHAVSSPRTHQRSRPSIARCSPLPSPRPRRVRRRTPRIPHTFHASWLFVFVLLLCRNNYGRHRPKLFILHCVWFLSESYFLKLKNPNIERNNSPDVYSFSNLKKKIIWIEVEFCLYKGSTQSPYLSELIMAKVEPGQVANRIIIDPIVYSGYLFFNTIMWFNVLLWTDVQIRNLQESYKNREFIRLVVSGNYGIAIFFSNIHSSTSVSTT